MSKGSKKTILVVLLVVVVGTGLLGFNNFSSPSVKQNGTAAVDADSKTPVSRVPCANSFAPAPEAYHIHPHLQIIVDGRQEAIPANIGMPFFGCERVVHTHDTTGEIHVEPNYAQDFTLGDFFGIWAQPLSKNQILDYKTDATHEIVMTVNGSPSAEFENLILKNDQKIVIEYRQIGQ